MFKSLGFLNSVRKFTRNQSSSTIYALSSGQGKCGVAVIRVSGPSSKTALASVTGLSNLPQPRTAILRSIKHPVTLDTLDKGLILWFPGPHSFTGEDCCEFHVHGSLAVINSLLNALSLIPNMRLAEPGEFTRRAFYNGKLDLIEVEGLADLLQAETEIQRKQAFLQSQGALSRLYNKWRNIMLKCVAHIEAHIDFDETETIDDAVLKNVSEQISVLYKEIRQHLDDGRKGELLRTGVKTVILGEPNVGKSSLLNLLCKRPAAIVTPIEGTTRDILEVTLNIGGYPLVVADTAGLRNKTDDVIEKEGINRALKSYDTADLIILMIDAQKYMQWLNFNQNKSITDYVIYYCNKLGLHNLISKKDKMEKMFIKECVLVLNKVDLVKRDFKLGNCKDIICLSCKNEEGVSVLLDNITDNLKILCGDPSAEHPSMNQARHKQHLSNCLKYLHLSLSDVNCDTVLMAEYLRKSLKHLGHLVGATTTEQILDLIFKDFCIGK